MGHALTPKASSHTGLVTTGYVANPDINGAGKYDLPLGKGSSYCEH